MKIKSIDFFKIKLNINIDALNDNLKVQQNLKQKSSITKVEKTFVVFSSDNEYYRYLNQLLHQHMQYSYVCVFNINNMIKIYILVLFCILFTQTNSITCQICMVTSGILSQSYRILPHSTAVAIMKAACMKQFNSDKVCESLSTQLTPVILPSLWWRVFNPEVFCGEIGWCPIKYKALNVTQQLERIINIPQTNKQQVRIDSGNSLKQTYKLLQLSDIHLDIQYREGYSTICKQTVCCHVENGISTNSSQNAGYYGNYRCDAPQTLLDAVVKNIRILEPEIDVVLLTGDLSAHNQWQKSTENNGEIVNKVIKKFQGWNVPVLLALGNNQCYPDHQYDPMLEGALKHNLAESMQKYLTVEQLKTLSSKGYYSKKVQNLGLTIIALNSMVCDDTNFYLIANVTDPSDQLKWLEKQLLKAQIQSSSVYIISHISPGITECSRTWSKIYRALSTRFNTTIKGHFYGHTHNDQFVILTNPLTKQPIGSIFQAPALSPISSHEPSFRVYEINSTTHEIINFKQYSSNLAQANNNKQSQMNWKQTYNFIEQYSLNNMNLESMVSLQSRLGSQQQILNKYRSHYDGGHSAGTGSKGIYCDTMDDRDSQYQCKGITAQDDKTVYLMEMLQGQWLERVD